VRLAQLAGVLGATLTVEDPLREWLPRLRSPELADEPLRGYLTGSIDAVLRIRSPHDAPTQSRYVVVDYKTNRLHPADVDPTVQHYRLEAMTTAMHAAHYPLQALLYQVALHRYLMWRQPGYDPERQLGGALYLFLRGMGGPIDTSPDGNIPGVFAWRPSASAILAVSDLLAGV
jgi:exodeoxyribonuclease V beta subunit